MPSDTRRSRPPLRFMRPSPLPAVALRERGLRSCSASEAWTALAGEHPECALGTAGADREPGGQVQRPSSVRKALLHLPVLQAVEGDHRRPAARPEQPGQRGEDLVQLAQLVVHRHPQCLEGPGGDVDPLGHAFLGTARFTTSAAARVVPGQRGLERASDGPGEGLFPSVRSTSGQLGDVEPGDQLRRRLALRLPSSCPVGRRSERRSHAPAVSSWGLLTPRSSSTPSTGSSPSGPSSASSSDARPCTARKPGRRAETDPGLRPPPPGPGPRR